MNPRQPDPSDLNDRAWSQVCRSIPAPQPDGCPATQGRPEIVHARVGPQLHGLPVAGRAPALPPWGTVPRDFCVWNAEGPHDRLHDERRGKRRVADGNQRPPSAALLDIPSVPTTEPEGSAAPPAPRKSRVASGRSSSLGWG